MNQVTLLCAESFNDVSLLGALTSCPLLKERGYQTEILYCGDENGITKEAGEAVRVIRLKLDSLKDALLASKTKNLLLSFADKQLLGLLFRLEEIGFLKEHKIRILGTSLRQYRTFYHQADQKSFLQDLGYQVPSSSLVSTVREAIEFSEQIQFPIVVWPLASKHGQGRRIANNLDDLCDAVENGLEVSPQGQCLLEFSTVGFKELEYIVVRDRQDNYYLAGNIESVDPVGIHSSDSYQVIPSLTLTDTEHQALREAALSIVRHLRLVGATSIKFALDPKSYQFYILEVNPFASDSFSTMSMALGYSIYHQALCLKLGDHLLDLPHPTMKGLTALFEPTLDRILFKLPVFPIEKVSRVLNTQIHSIGALYGFGTSLEEAYQQAVENFGSDQWPKNILKDVSDDELIQRIAKRMPYRFSSILEAFHRGFEMEEVSDLSRMDPFYLQFLYNIYLFERQEQPQTNHSLKFHPLDLTAGFGHVGEKVSYYISICGEDEAPVWSQWTLLVDPSPSEDSSQILRIIERLNKERENGRKVALLSQRPFVGHAADTCLRIPLSVYETYQEQINRRFGKVVQMNE
ncbi:ATP-grasp domain-containing protein [Streptococcus ilei]|uniref:ATP-binding protein n=1 Tax=Streptococcus ilei TaxID=1156431 RepID=UPI001FD1BE8F|nr:ATP-grasp domain-containing protein [Streptococcus ilei]